MKIAAITGGGQGIGRAIAYGFADAGYAVSLIDPDADAGRETLEHIRGSCGHGLFGKGDVSHPGDVEAWAQRTREELGVPDVLINNAGISRNGPFLELELQDFDRVLSTNLRGTFLCAQAIARQMADRGEGGAIINIASTRAFMSEPGTEAYSASKGGIIALTHAMAISLGEQGIRVNAISPGWIETADWQYSKRARKPHHSLKDKAQHPVGRVGRPEDIAEACLFLAEKAGFMTGQSITIDGGMTVKMIYAE
jgi:NAD(P)-dependent dehydrogenase (short-subunit alcohol dehydrogenase family)